MAILNDGEAMVVLRGETDPERRRKTIGRLFVEVFEEEVGRLENAR